MKPKGNWIELMVISSLFVLLSVWGIIWDISSGLLAGGIDGIMLLFVCLMMAGIFAVMLLLQLQKAGIIPAFGGAKAKTAGAASTKPAAASAPAVKAASPAPQPTAQTK
jgi:bacteriorhodopsin